MFYSQMEIDDMIRKLTNVLLTRTLSGALSELMKRPTLSLLQVTFLFTYYCVLIYLLLFVDLYYLLYI